MQKITKTGYGKIIKSIVLLHHYKSKQIKTNQTIGKSKPFTPFLIYTNKIFDTLAIEISVLNFTN